MQQKKEFTRYAGPRLRGRRTVLECGQAGFPEALCEIADPPDKLYVVGNPEALGEGIAIVGARNATPYGTSCARRFSSLAAKRGIPVISGGARGCDAAAHRAALDSGGTTVAFLGGGCDELYPAAHYGLFQDIVDAGGAVASEQAWAFPPMKHTFRARNRLIAGLAKATLIVEAGMPSGTFSTADEALAANREVLVVPGSIASKSARGSNRLLYQGAIPIVDDETFAGVVEAIYGQQEISGFSETCETDALPPSRDGLPGAVPTCGPEDEDAILEAICSNPMSIEDMLGYVEERGFRERYRIEGNAITFLMVRLAELQRSGRVVRYPDGRYGPVVV